MKAIAFVISFVCVCSARNIKWSPEMASDDIAGNREVIKEQIHKFWQGFENFFDEYDEYDEESVREFLHLAFEAYRPNHEIADEIKSSTDRDSVNSHRPFPHPHVPLPLHDGVKPFPYVDIPRPFDDVSKEIVDGEIVRPFPQKHHSNPAERDEEMEKSYAHKPIMRPLDDVSGEIKDQMMKPLPHKPNQRPSFDGVNGEMEKFIPQKHRPLYAPGKLDIEKP